MRLSFRFRIGSTTVFFMVSSTQRLGGVLSRADPEKQFHYLFFDMENCSLEECERQLRQVQVRYRLPDIYIVSDHSLSFHGYCFAVVPRKYMLHILTDPALENIDQNFFLWTVVRGEATLRMCLKQDRPPQQVVSVLPSYPVPIPELERVVYDTGLVKRGVAVVFDNGRLKIHG